MQSESGRVATSVRVRVGVVNTRVPSPSERQGCQVGATNASWLVHSCGNTSRKGWGWPNFWANLAYFSLWAPAPARRPRSRPPRPGQQSTEPRAPAPARRPRHALPQSAEPIWAPAPARRPRRRPPHPAPDSKVPSPEHRHPPADHATVAESKPRHSHPWQANPSQVELQFRNQGEFFRIRHTLVRNQMAVWLSPENNGDAWQF
jgi:hypothetical protein